MLPAPLGRWVPGTIACDAKAAEEYEFCTAALFGGVLMPFLSGGIKRRQATRLTGRIIPLNQIVAQLFPVI